MIHLRNVSREAPVKAEELVTSKSLDTLIATWLDALTNWSVATWSTFVTMPASKVFGFPAA